MHNKELRLFQGEDISILLQLIIKKTNEKFGLKKNCLDVEIILPVNKTTSNPLFFRV